jgi:hypothetical protein
MATLGAALLAVAATGCSLDELLEVELPGNVEAADLDDPRLSGPLVRGAQADFECGFTEFVRWTGTWSGVADGGGGRPGQFAHARGLEFAFYADHCEGTAPNYAPLQTARAQAKNAAELIEGFSEEEVPDKEIFLARARVYEGWSILLLSEAYCGVTFDLGPLLTRGEGFELADQKFEAAIQHASQVADQTARDTPSLLSASDVRNAAMIGRARAHLQLGDDAGVLQYANQVDDGFIFYSTHDLVPARRQHEIGDQPIIDFLYQDMGTLQGVPDPRVPVYQTSNRVDQANHPIWTHTKYDALGEDDTVVASWRDALLYIAEVQGGQTAIDIINELRTTVSDLPWVPDGTYNLPPFTGPADAETSHWPGVSGIEAQVRIEGMRERFLQGAEMGDRLRWGGPWMMDRDWVGRAIVNENTCMHIPDYEVFANPNLERSPTEPT